MPDPPAPSSEDPPTPSSEDEKKADETTEEGESKKDETAKSELESKSETASDEEEEQEEEEGEEEEEDDASPEAIARRVAALGDEDEIEKIAREEEKKLAERKAKRRGRKGGLERSASKRLARIGSKAKPQREVASAIEAAEPLLERTARAEDWAKKNQKTVWGVVGAVVLVGGAYGTYAYLDRQKAVAASVELSQAVADEHARIGDPDKEADDPDKIPQPGPVFKTFDDRREAALGKYREVASKYPSTGAATLARLGEASMLLDKHDGDGALTAFTDASQSPLAKADTEVMGRALEGMGFAYELKASAAKDPAERDKQLDSAITQFRALENTDVLGFKELGMYHQARCLETKGDKAKAIETLKSLHERLNAPGENHPLPYLQELGDDRLRRLDPSALPAKQTGTLGGPSGHSLTEAQIKQILQGHQGKP